MSSPSFDRRLSPQHGQAFGFDTTTRTRGRWAGKGWREGLRRSAGPGTAALATARSAARASAPADTSSSLSRSSYWSMRRCVRSEPLAARPETGGRRPIRTAIGDEASPTCGRRPHPSADRHSECLTADPACLTGLLHSEGDVQSPGRNKGLRSIIPLIFSLECIHLSIAPNELYLELFPGNPPSNFASNSQAPQRTFPVSGWQAGASGCHGDKRWIRTAGLIGRA